MINRIANLVRAALRGRPFSPPRGRLLFKRKPEPGSRRSNGVMPLSAPNDHRYIRVEYERRFLVNADWTGNIEPYSKTFEDTYLSKTRLRLRLLTDNDTGRRVVKLNQKCESPSPYFRTVSRILLSQDEYLLLDRLDGYRLRKIRYYHYYLGRMFAIDVFEGDLDGLVLCEIEAEKLEDLMSAQPPAYASTEVTEDAFFTGGSLCQTTRAELLSKLREYQTVTG